MRPDEIGRVFALAEDSFERAAASSAKAGRAMARADDIMARTSSRDTAARAAARRERQRLNAGLGRILVRVGLVIAAVWIATIFIGMVKPIGMFGLLAAIAVGVVLASGAVFGSRKAWRPKAIAPDLPGGVLVDRLDSYLYRARPALPAPAQAEVDGILATLPTLRPVLERVGPGDPGAQDARRLMSTHLPNLIDRYLNVPGNYRGDSDGDGVSVDQRLVDALRAGREALDDSGKLLARGDVAAFETQGRFIESRYGDQPLDR